MSTSDSTVKIDLASMNALLARDSLDIIEFEDAIANDDKRWEPVTQRRAKVIGYIHASGRGILPHYEGHIYDADTFSGTWTAVNSFRLSKEEEGPRSIKWYPGNHPSMAQKLVRELGRLANGWAGPDTMAPSSHVLRDIQLVASSLPSRTRIPEAEVDPDDGAVILRWLNENATRSFSLTFVGAGNVTGFYSADNSAEPAWKMSVSDATRLAIKFGAEVVQSLLTQ